MTTMPLSILYFGNDWDAENRTSSHQMALRLNAKADLLYVECPGLRRPSGSARDLRKLLDKIRKTLAGPRIAGGMRVYTLFQMPFHGSALARYLNRALVGWQIRRLRRSLAHEQPILWFVVPHLPYLPRAFPDCFSAYYCVDKYAAIPGVDSHAVAAMDAELTRVADLVFVASEKVLTEKSRVRSDVQLSPHGVDFEHFSKAAELSSKRPADLPEWPGKVVGFFGLIEDWIDLDLLAHIAMRHPDWLIVLIGHEAVDVSRLRALPNVALLGKKPFAELPTYGRLFDVALLPYRPTEQVIHSNPIKLREYLAMGKPVVCKRFPHAEQFAHVVYLADDRDEFVAQIERAIVEDSPQAIRRRMDSVRTSTWEARAEAALKLAVARRGARAAAAPEATHHRTEQAR
jgi:glycosyltransferase involved in cell wall biosynthesis